MASGAYITKRTFLQLVQKLLQCRYDMWSALEHLGVNWITGIILGALVIYWISWRNSRFVRLIEKIPGPQGWPLIGNLQDFNCDRVELLRKTNMDWSAQYGDIYKFWLGNQPFVCLAAPHLIEPVLSTMKHSDKIPESRFLKPWLGDSVFLSNGQKWKRRRRIITPAFHFQILHSFLDVFIDQGVSLAQCFERHVDAKPHEELDIFPLVTKSTLDIICETSMGKKVRAQKETSTYVSSLHRMGELLVERFFNPLYLMDALFYRLPPGREMTRLIATMHRFTEQVIRDRRAELEREWNNSSKPPVDSTTEPEKKKHLAFLDLLLTAARDDPSITNTHIREEVDTVMVAGHDTTASTISWFLYCIARHPEYQQRCFEELNEIFGDSDRCCTPEDVARMKYLECCIKETMRLYPSIPSVFRTIEEDTVLGGYTIPQGTSVIVQIYGMHRNFRVFEEPEKFDPGRFHTDETLQRHPFSFIPFSAGPKNCIGQKYAMLEIKVVLAILLRKFHFSTTDKSGQLEYPSGEVVLKPKGEIRLLITKR